MIAYLKGNILHCTLDSCIIEVNGVGYEVLLSGSAHDCVSGKTTGAVYTYMQVREDGVSLFGFSSIEEKNLFLQLISVSGVGPKMGIGILSQLSPVDVVSAIATGNVKKLCTVKGLGKKTAERLVLELKEKMGISGTGNESEGIELPGEQDDDAVAALMSLGFTRAEALVGVKKAKNAGANGVEEVIMFALKSM